MADEIRVTNPGTTDAAVAGAHTHAGEIERNADIEATIPAHPGGGAVADPEMARADIEQTRARMSETIGEIEEVLTRRKGQIQDKLDVFSPIRERPLPSAGIALGAGLLLGLLTGGSDDRDDYDARYRTTRYEGDGESGYWRQRAETWEHRARRLRDIAREKEEDLRDVQEDWGEARAAAMSRRRTSADWDDDYQDNSPGAIRSTIDELREGIVGGLAGFLSNAVEQFTASRSSESRHG